jgi:succinyl-CoA synthetase beta subunit
MKIHEYQGKEILRQFGVPVPRGYPAFSVHEASEAAQKLGGPVWVVKAQIHAGGRGKGGGVKLARSLDEVKKLAGEILGMQLKTHQTGPEGQKVRRLLVEEGADIKKEYYVAAVTDRATQKVALMASSEGGMDIEEVAHATPEKIIKVFVDPLAGLTDAQAAQLARGEPAPDRAEEPAGGPAQRCGRVKAAPLRSRGAEPEVDDVGHGRSSPGSWGGVGHHPRHLAKYLPASTSRTIVEPSSQIEG